MDVYFLRLYIVGRAGFTTLDPMPELAPEPEPDTYTLDLSNFSSINMPTLSGNNCQIQTQNPSILTAYMSQLVGNGLLTVINN